ncbi:MAG: tRNA (adenosine(37)-N6)-threonylcarbamoyltransferase complex dimerization subunit type 1 TsaB [Bacteroidota bacterium]|nr:tRNA (adenosine(37)-N6)-threonylcarbamoyltransferase complex dimerization subunit type 1 TsaB [Bacteroidota bacterium]
MIKSPLILSIETATDICSVALAKGEKILCTKTSTEPNSHSKLLATFIQEVFANYGDSLRKDLNAIAISKGPGSYTGLRIGVSSAKGLAYALDIPLIAIDTLKILAHRAKIKYNDCYYLPMIDARRMEVYTALYDENMNVLKDISADIIEGDLYENYHRDKKIVVVGNGASKCKEILSKDIYIFDGDINLNAEYMTWLALDKYNNKEFEDTAYFEPYYLKDFIAKKSVVKGLY